MSAVGYCYWNSKKQVAALHFRHNDVFPIPSTSARLAVVNSVHLASATHRAPLSRPSCDLDDLE